MIAASVNPSMRPFLPVADNLLIYRQNVKIGRCFWVTDFRHLVGSQVFSRHGHQEGVFTDLSARALFGFSAQEQSIWLVSSEIQKSSGRFWLTHI